MARGAIATTNSVVHGVVVATETTGNATDNHYLTNSGKTKLFVRNSGATPRDVTIHISKQVQGQTVDPIVEAIPAGQTWVFGPFPVTDFGSQINVDVAHAELMLRGIE